MSAHGPGHHSVDGAWWWTGIRWVSAWSDDRRWWFNGSDWVAAPGAEESQLPESNDEEGPPRGRPQRVLAWLENPPGPSPTLWEEMKGPGHRGLLIMLVFVPALAWAAMREVLQASTTEARVLWAWLIAACVLAVVSYLLRFTPAVLGKAWWSASWPRRVSRLIVRWAWAVTFISLFVTSLVFRFG